MSEHIISTASDGVQRVRLNRPDKKNAITSAMYTALTDALHAADSDTQIRVITISGSGDSFSSGNDLADFLASDAGMEDSPVTRFLDALGRVNKPLIAGVNGMAVGIGVTMLFHCDLVYASEIATFQLPFTNLGLVPEAGSSMLLPLTIGHQRAAELMLLGERFDARQASQLGMVNAVVPGDELDGVVWDRAKILAAKPWSAVQATKRLLRRPAESISERMAVENAEFGRLLKSPEARTIMQAFLDRSKGRYPQ